MKKKQDKKQEALNKALDATLKHLSEMRKAGLLEMTPDREDERRRLYHLHPAVKILSTEAGREMDFGCAVMRW